MINKSMYPDIKWVLNQWGEFPADFSDNACRIVSEHYFAKGEESFFEVVCRITSAIAGGGFDLGHFSTDVEAQQFASDLGGILLRQEAAFNSPVYYNLGVNEDPQCSACFIQSVEDNMEDILDLAKKEGMLFKYGSGTGTNLSSLRGRGFPLSGGGEASGPVAFMRMYDSVASTIKSGGRTRRAAKMVLLDCDHPDFEEFIDCKVVEDRKARRLIDSGFDPVEAYDSVQFQNGNNSVRLTDEFMREATDDILKVRVENVPARQLDMIAKAAWECGDPGVQFTDTINKAHQVPEAGSINASNPCSEFVFLDETACNLASINLVKCNPIDHRLEFKAAVDLLITAMDIIVGIAGYPTWEIASNSRMFRPLGLGYTNLAAYLMRRGVRYGSDEALEITETITSNMSYDADLMSIHLERTLGSPWGGEYRNAQRTLLAPTGTISFMMDCESTGIEPVFAEEQTKHLSDGTTMVISPVCVSIGRERDAEAVVTAVGNDTVTPTEHIAMMAAAQPYLCGAISKTVNVPADWTWEQVRQLYVDAWKAGLKCIAVYRDGSKGIQPLTAKPKSTSTDEYYGEADSVSLCHREPMPDTRSSVTHKFTLGGITGYMTVGLYEDGRPGELFVNISKEGSTLGGLCDAWATCFSLLLQNGYPLAKLVKKFKGYRFDPAGFTGSADVRSATSIVDYIASWLEVRFLPGEDAVPGPSDAGATDNGNVCVECGGSTIRTGTCETCPTCGYNTGCG